MTPAERSLEMGIRHADEAMRKASTPQGKRAAFRLLADLVANRGEAQTGPVPDAGPLRPETRGHGSQARTVKDFDSACQNGVR